MSLLFRQGSECPHRDPGVGTPRPRLLRGLVDIPEPREMTSLPGPLAPAGLGQGAEVLMREPEGGMSLVQHPLHWLHLLSPICPQPLFPSSVPLLLLSDRISYFPPLTGTLNCVVSVFLVSHRLPFPLPSLLSHFLPPPRPLSFLPPLLSFSVSVSLSHTHTHVPLHLFSCH